MILEPYMYILMRGRCWNCHISALTTFSISSIWTSFIRGPWEWSGKVIEDPDATNLKLQGDEAIKKKHFRDSVGDSFSDADVDGVVKSELNERMSYCGLSLRSHLFSPVSFFSSLSNLSIISVACASCSSLRREEIISLPMASAASRPIIALAVP